MRSHWEQMGLLIVAAATACVWMFFLALTPQGVFWTSDGGNKFIVMENVERHGSLEIGYPAAQLDPELKFFPYSGHHFQQLNGKIHSFYPPYFSFLSLPFYKTFGFYGLYVLPLLCGLFCLFACHGIGRVLGLGGWRLTLSVALLAFGTPLLFYTVTFWEHTPAMLPAALAVLFVLKSLPEEGRRRNLLLLTAGLLLGVSSVLREEGYVMLAAFACGLLWTGKWRCLPILIAGWAIPMMPVWIFQYSEYGSLLGPHANVYTGLAGESTPWSFISGKMQNFYVYLFRSGESGKLALLLASPFLVATLTGFLSSRSSLRPPVSTLILWSSVVSGIILAGCAILSSSPVFDCIFTQALFTGMPFLVVFLLGTSPLLSSQKNELRFAGALCLSYIIGTCLLLNQADMGIIWGARHFLALLPLLVPLCLILWGELFISSGPARPHKVWAAAGILLLLLSVLLQCHGLRTLSLKLEASAFLKTKIAESPKPILSDIFWLPEELATLFHERPIMQISTKHRLPEALRQLKASGVESFSLILSPQYRLISREEMLTALSLVDISAGPEIRTPGAEFMECQVFFCKFR